MDRPEHRVEAEPVEKLRDGIIGYRYVCSCGRRGNGHHRTPEQAIEAGQHHFGGDALHENNKGDRLQ